MLPDLITGMHGETVTVIEHEVTRERGVQRSATTTRDVAGVLVSQPDTSALQQLGANVTYRLDWPKSDHSDLRGREVVVRGRTFAVIGDPGWYSGVAGAHDRPVYVAAKSEAANG